MSIKPAPTPTESGNHGIIFTFLVGIFVIAAILVVPVLNNTHDFCNGPSFKVDTNQFPVLNRETTANFLPADDIRAHLMTEKGLLIGFGDRKDLSTPGLALVTPSGITLCTPVNGHVNSILAVGDDFVVATDGNGVWWYHKDGWSNYTVDNGLPNNSTYGLAIGTDGYVYVGTYSGVARFYPSADSWLLAKELTNDQLTNKIHTLLFLPDDIWLGTIDGGINRIQNGHWTNYRHGDVSGEPLAKQLPELDSDNIRVIKQSPDGKIWVGSDPGLAIYDPSTQTWEHKTPGDVLQGCGVLDVTFWQVPAGGYNTWIASTCGTYYDDGNGFKPWMSQYSLAVAVGQSGQFLFGKAFAGTTNGLYQIQFTK